METGVSVKKELGLIGARKFGFNGTRFRFRAVVFHPIVASSGSPVPQVGDKSLLWQVQQLE